ncbi:endonuclease/exonuclease/phosphatase family protein [Nonomuraea typhae]|uniref:endonuclease/exonuclease/phosphatase family protein n=1 Tax=Nonomuraea typhae TaxID=2603600 RepID=UPI0012FA0F71|nr:endonuclease/exonuclease/phosphatase family protein [Nonomuraea typhae]
MRVLTWNIWNGGRDDLPLIVEQVAAVAPDVFVCVETYGAAPAILAGLPGYTGTRITARDRDNLWIFTRLPVTHVFPPSFDDFRFGGIRVSPGVNVFATWLNFSEPWLGDVLAAGGDGRADERVQYAELSRIVHEELPRLLDGHSGPVVVAGDLNVLPAADRPQLRTTRILEDAGYTDTFRALSADPGHTWSARPDLPLAERIDYIFAKDLKPLRSWTLTRRLSDHAALVTDF